MTCVPERTPQSYHFVFCFHLNELVNELFFSHYLFSAFFTAASSVMVSAKAAALIAKDMMIAKMRAPKDLASPNKHHYNNRRGPYVI